MSAYQYPAAPSGVPAATTPDPTAVFGRRCAAIVVDFLLYLLIMSFVGPTPLSPLAEYYEDVPAGVDACEVVRDAENVSTCVEIGDRVYFTDSDDAPVQGLVWLLVVVGYVVLQGATGRTPGKAIFGLKAVDEQGGTPGFGKSLLRSVLWIVDSLPCLGLVAFITGLTSKGHRRVGDMAAKTFVVGKAHAGPVVVPGLATAASYGAAPGAPGAGGPWGPGPGPGGPASPWGAPQHGAPQAQPGQPAPWGAPQQGGYPPPGGQARPAPDAWTAPGAAPTPGAAPSGETRPAPPQRGATPAGAPSDAPPGPGSGGERGATGETPRAGTSAGPGEPSPASPGGEAPGSPASPTAPQESGGTGTGAQGTAGAGGAASQSGYNPQWDAARGTYIVWEPQRQQWLGWDESSKQWRPL